mmetsp:Transcript_17394/g.66257  ORF Transcript_17394/g.66257 Transcript_17394/m.66257 type:complete len:221 (-) Transcript_17394:97-759(-)
MHNNRNFVLLVLAPARGVQPSVDRFQDSLRVVRGPVVVVCFGFLESLAVDGNLHGETAGRKEIGARRWGTEAFSQEMASLQGLVDKLVCLKLLWHSQRLHRFRAAGALRVGRHPKHTWKLLCFATFPLRYTAARYLHSDVCGIVAAVPQLRVQGCASRRIRPIHKGLHKGVPKGEARRQSATCSESQVSARDLPNTEGLRRLIFAAVNTVGGRYPLQGSS